MSGRARYPHRPLRFRIMNRLVQYLPVSRKYHHNSILFRKELTDTAAVSVPDGYHFIEAGRTEIERIVRHPEALIAEVYENRIKHGHRCYCLLRGPEILSYNWVSTRCGCVLCGFSQGIEFLPLKAHQAFTYDFYTYKARRGRGYGTLAKKLLHAYLAAGGINEVYALVQPYSVESLRIHMGLDARALRMVYGYRVLGWCRTFYGRDRDRGKLEAWLQQFNRSKDKEDANKNNER